MDAPDSTKQCSRCKDCKIRSEFSLAKRSKDGLQRGASRATPRTKRIAVTPSVFKSYTKKNTTMLSIDYSGSRID
jgi:hypothetical protein